MSTQYATTNVTAASIMDLVASLMNDTAKTVYTYTAQLPYLQMALNELQEYMQLNNIPVTNATSANITIRSGTTVVNPSEGPGNTSSPNYPTDLTEIQGIYERLAGSDDPFVEVSKREFEPAVLVGQQASQLIFWWWMNQRIHFLGATTDREIRINYIKSVIPNPLTSESRIEIINSKSFLQFRTAALCAIFIGENPTRGNELNQYAVLAVDRVIGIGTKGKQAIQTRRRPFMAAYKQRGY